jgi:hypothetical protein
MNKLWLLLLICIYVPIKSAAAAPTPAKNGSATAAAVSPSSFVTPAKSTVAMSEQALVQKVVATMNLWVMHDESWRNINFVEQQSLQVEAKAKEMLKSFGISDPTEAQITALVAGWIKARAENNSLQMRSPSVGKAMEELLRCDVAEKVLEKKAQLKRLMPLWNQYEAEGQPARNSQEMERIGREYAALLLDKANPEEVEIAYQALDREVPFKALSWDLTQKLEKELAAIPGDDDTDSDRPSKKHQVRKKFYAQHYKFLTTDVKSSTNSKQNH